jgi:hypothetical protein
LEKQEKEVGNTDSNSHYSNAIVPPVHKREVIDTTPLKSSDNGNLPLKTPQKRRKRGRPTNAERAKDLQEIPNNFSNLKLWEYKAIQLKFSHPNMEQKDIATECGKTPASICQFFSSARFKNAIVEYGKERLFWLIPKALASFSDILEKGTPNAKLNACIKVLEDSGVLSKETITKVLNQINTQINVSSLNLKQKSVQELNEMLINQIKGFDMRR